MIIVELPSTMSGLLRIVLEDMKKCAKDPRYTFDMSEWHNTNITSGHCHVCMAGAIMAQTMQCPIDIRATPSAVELDTKLANKLRAVNEMRGGDFAEASHLLGFFLYEHKNHELLDFYRNEAIPSQYGPNFFEKWELMYNKLVELGL